MFFWILGQNTSLLNTRWSVSGSIVMPKKFQAFQEVPTEFRRFPY